MTHGTRPMPTPERPTPGPRTASVSDGTGPLTAIAISTLSQAVEMLREDLANRERLSTFRARAGRTIARFGSPEMSPATGSPIFGRILNGRSAPRLWF